MKYKAVSVEGPWEGGFEKAVQKTLDYYSAQGWKYVNSITPSHDIILIFKRT